jgi:hypothetical protein
MLRAGLRQSGKGFNYSITRRSTPGNRKNGDCQGIPKTAG